MNLDFPKTLDFFVQPGWRPRVRPASPKRDWMDATADRFAYRCLPLAIANAHGWEIGAACGFEARWDGGYGVESVEIRADPGTPAWRMPVSLFGHGTVTFHVEAIVRTPPGWNLWVGGPPNGAKDGIAPLGAAIETDWSPYTFTMNWRFTRADHWIRFEEDEAFCFLFPVQRGLLDGVRPAVRPIDEEPGLRDAFDGWAASRSAFQQWVKDTRPTKPADSWQKLYFRGVNPDGSPGAADHESKLRVPPPSWPEGAAPAACPAGRGGAARPDAAPSAPIEDGPIPPGRALRRRDWLLDAQERQRGLSELVGQVQWVRDLSSEEFLDNFYAPGRPALIEGELDDWPATARWTPERLHEAMDGGDPAEALAGDVGPLPKFATDAPGAVRIDADGAFAPLRFEPRNLLVAQVSGRRRVLLFPPSETAKLYNRRGTSSEVGDVSDPEMLRRYPLVAQARCFAVEVGAGELLYLPVGWWHQSTALGIGATVTFTEFIWPNDAAESFPND